MKKRKEKKKATDVTQNNTSFKIIYKKKLDMERK